MKENINKTNLSIIFLCLSYLLFEFLFIPHWTLTADEFVFAKHISEYTIGIPYLDFEPYKSVLGHYLLSLPLFFTQGLFEPIFRMKEEIAIINTACIAITCFWSMRLFDKRAVLLTLFALLANHYFIIYSTDLRVDLLATWACLFSALAALQMRWRLSGLLFSIGFLVSQKALWYFAAINGSLVFCYALFRTSSYSLRSIFQFNIAAIIPVVIYLMIWSFIASPTIVLHNFFYDAYVQAGIDFYLPIYWGCWATVLSHGPFLFLLWPVATYLSIANQSFADALSQRRLFIVCVATIALILFIRYKQPFPYNFVFVFPAFFLLYAEFFTLFTPRRSVFFFLFIVAGIFFPFYQSLKGAVSFNGHYQQTITSLAATLLKDEGDYVGGIPFLFTKDQPIEGMKNLIGPQIEYIETPSEKMGQLLLPSLYLAPTSPEKIIDDFERGSVKLLISNYRLFSLPPKVITYFKDHYQHYYGGIYLYAPVIHANQLSFYLKFGGKYRIESKSTSRLTIDGKRYHAGQLIELKKGDHLCYAKKDFRLTMVPDITMKLNPAYQKDYYLLMNRPIVS